MFLITLPYLFIKTFQNIWSTNRYNKKLSYTERKSIEVLTKMNIFSTCASILHMFLLSLRQTIELYYG